MKKIISITLCSIVVAGLLISAKILCTPILMRNANFGSSYLKNRGQIDTLFIGSSMFRQGVATHLLSSEENNTYLLAYNGNQPFSIYLMIEDLIKENVEIKNLYVDMYAYSLTADVSLSDVRIIQDTSFKFTLSLYKEMQQHGSAGIGELFEMVMKANNEIFFTWPISYPLINSRYVRGANTSVSNGKTAEELRSLPLTFGNMEANTYQKQSLEKLIALCKNNGINIFFLETPKYSYLYESETYCSIIRDYSTFIDAYDCVQILTHKTAENCGIAESQKHIIYSFDSNNATYFTDLLHLSSDGRACLTEILKVLTAK